MNAIKLYLIPGTGTDGRLFTPQLEQFPDIITPEWLAPLEKKEPITSYAKRLAATIDTSSPFILGGVSLGGMIAQEMATSLKPVAVILISTCSSYKAIPLMGRLAGRLERALPNFIVKWQFSSAAKMLRKSNTKNKEIYAQMLEEMPPSLARWQSGAATEWELRQKLAMPIFHVHGSKDKIVPVTNIKSPAVITDGGHLINITHSEQVNKFIEECLNRSQNPALARAV